MSTRNSFQHVIDELETLSVHDVIGDEADPRDAKRPVRHVHRSTDVRRQRVSEHRSGSSISSQGSQWRARTAPGIDAQRCGRSSRRRIRRATVGILQPRQRLLRGTTGRSATISDQRLSIQQRQRVQRRLAQQ